MVGVEAGGEGIRIGKHAARFKADDSVFSGNQDIFARE